MTLTIINMHAAEPLKWWWTQRHKQPQWLQLSYVKYSESNFCSIFILINGWLTLLESMNICVMRMKTSFHLITAYTTFDIRFVVFFVDNIQPWYINLSCQNPPNCVTKTGFMLCSSKKIVGIQFDVLTSQYFDSLNAADTADNCYFEDSTCQINSAARIIKPFLHQFQKQPSKDQLTVFKSTSDWLRTINIFTSTFWS